MFKKLFAFSIICCLFVVQAHATAQNGLKAAFDELNYALTVEWDQSNREFYDSQMEQFKTNLASLQEQGLSNQDLVNFTLAQVKDQKMANDLETAFTMISINKMSEKEAQRYVTDIMNKSYSRGASWGGEVIVGAIVLILIVAVAAIVAGKARVEDGCYKIRVCEDYCTGGICYTDCDWKCVD
jgi:hypothetical protein